MPGSPTKYTPERVGRFLQAIRGGSSQKDAAAYAGVTENTIINWRQRHLDFLDAYTRAEAECAVSMSAHLVKAAADDWRAALAWLERRRRDEWGKTDKLEVTLKREAERLAEELGLDAADVLAEAERLVGAHAGNG